MTLCVNASTNLEESSVNILKFNDAHRLRIEKGNVVYNSKNNSYLEKALDGVPIELCYNNDYDTITTIIKKNTVTEKNSSSLEKCSYVYKNIIKEKYLINKTRKIKNTKRKSRHYKNFDIDNECEICGIIGHKHEYGCKNELQNTLDYHNMQYNEGKISILRELFNSQRSNSQIFNSQRYIYNYINNPNYYDYTAWVNNLTDYVDTYADNYVDNYIDNYEEIDQFSRTLNLLEFEIRQLSRINETEFLNDNFF